MSEYTGEWDTAGEENLYHPYQRINRYCLKEIKQETEVRACMAIKVTTIRIKSRNKFQAVGTGNGHGFYYKLFCGV